jgi:hypothetical protein
MNDTFNIRTSTGDDDFDVLVRRRLQELADRAPTAVRQLDEIMVAPIPVGRRSARRRTAGIGATIAALVGAVGITTVALNGAGSGGAGTPNEAVLLFVEAIEREDVLGMIDVVDPAEVPALRAAVQDGSAEAKRVQLLGEGFDLSGVDGFDVAVDHLTLETEPISTGVAVVTASAGVITTAFDPALFPYGAQLSELSGTGRPTTSVTDFGQRNGDVFLATVQRDGRWFVSIGYTIAEYARRAADVELPSGDIAVGPGFETPEDAVTAFYRSLAAFDFDAAVATAAPGEGDALIAYGSLWLPAARQVSNRIHDEGYQFTVTDIGFQSTGGDDRRTLQATSFVIDGAVPTFDETAAATPGGQALRIVRADGCTTWSGPGAARFIQDDGPTAPGDGFTTVGDGEWRSCEASPLGVGAVVLAFAAGGLTELPDIVTTEVNGRWYVSPLGTVASSVVDLLRDIPDGASLFDSPLGSIVYGASHDMLEAVYVGQSNVGLVAGCEALFEIDASGTITAVVDDPSVALVRECGSSYVSFGGSSSGEGIAPEATVQASTDLSASTVPVDPLVPTTIAG